MAECSLRDALGSDAWTLLSPSASSSELQAKIDSSSDSNPAGTQPKRAVAKFTGRYQRFMLEEKRYTKQFSHLYLHRLLALRSAMLASAEKKWGGECARVEKVIDLASGDQGYVIGTLYKEQKYKPCVLDEFTDEMAGKNLVVARHNFASEDDSFILEDESGRVTLEGAQGS
jgi:DNA polymerase delta subunit 2